MKRITRTFVFYLIAIYLAEKFIPGLKITTDLRGFLTSVFFLTLFFLVLEPLIRFLLLPVNLLSMGLFSFLSQIITFSIFLKVFPNSFHIVPWHFNGFALSQIGLQIQPFDVAAWLSIILATFFISFIVYLLSLLL